MSLLGMFFNTRFALARCSTKPVRSKTPWYKVENHRPSGSDLFRSKPS